MKMKRNILILSLVISFSSVMAQSNSDSLDPTKSVQEFCRRLSEHNPGQAHWYYSALSILKKIYVPIDNGGNHRGILSSSSSDDIVKKKETDIMCTYAEILSDQSYTLLFQSNPEEAEQLARSALSINPSLIEAQTNLAAALLLQGKYAEAKSYYLRYKYDYRDIFLLDLKMLMEAGAIPAERKDDVEKIKTLLNVRGN